VTVDFQEAKELFENLVNPNKSRARGPSGRKPPTRKIKSQYSKVNNIEPNALKVPVVKPLQLVLTRTQNKACESDTCVTKPSNGEPTNIGKIDPADFDKVWFFRVPTNSFSTRKQMQDRCEDKSHENNNTTKNLFDNEVSKQDEGKTVMDKGKEKEDDLAKSKNKKLKAWKTCEIL